METPWSRREGRLDRHTNPLKGDLREYRSGIQELVQVVVLSDES